jgi:general secretion pathway protein I
MLTAMLQTQLTAFGEIVKRSLREVRLTVTWPVGRRTQSFTVVTHLVVLNPRAPGGARGDNPDVPAEVATAGTLNVGTLAPGQLPGQPQGPPRPTPPGLPPPVFPGSPRGQ